MKKLVYLLAIASLLLTGCYKDEISQLEKEMSDLENTEIASLQEQVKNVTASIGTLEALSSELKEYINKLTEASASLKGEVDAVNAKLDQVKTSLQTDIDQTKAEIINRLETSKAELEKQITQINTVLSALEEKSEAIDKKITDLKTYADATYAAKDWVSGTFATLEAQNALLEEVETIKASITTLTSSIAQIETNVRTMVGEKLDALTQSLEAKLQQAIKDVTAGYTSAITDAKKEVTDAYTAAIGTAIENSETAIMKWVNEQLADYYTVAKADAQIKAFKDILGYDDIPAGSTLQGEIDQLIEDLAAAKKSVIETYEKLISEAITTSEGKITSKYDQEVNSMKQNISKLTSTADELKAQLKELQAKVSNLEKAMEEANKTLAQLSKSLEELNSAFESFIGDYKGSSLSKIVEDLNKAIEACKKDIESQTGLISQLEESIAQLQADVDKLLELEEALKQAEKQIKVLETFIDGYESTTLAKIKKDLEDKIAACAKAEDLQALEDIVNGKEGVTGLVDRVKALETSLESINTSISSIEKFLAGYDLDSDTLAKLLEALQKQIDECIGKESKIGTDIEALTKRVQDIEALATKISELSEDIATAEKKIEAIEAFLKDKPDGTLAKLLSDVKKQLEDLTKAGEETKEDIQKKIDTINELLFGEGGSESSPKEGSILYRINALEAQLLVKNFQSIAYVPTFSDGSVLLSKNSSGNYSGYFTFVVRPAALATVLANNTTNCSMRWLSTPSKADIGTAFDSINMEGSASGQLNVTATINNPSDNLLTTLKNGASAALFVNIAKTASTAALEFTSKFIPLSISSIIVDPTSELEFENTKGDTKYVYVTGAKPKDIAITAPDWLETPVKEEISKDYTKVTFKTKSANETYEKKTGNIIFTFTSGKREEKVVMTATQKPGEQKFDKIYCDGVELTPDTQGKRYMNFLKSGSSLSHSIEVETSLGGNTWSVSTTGMSDWLSIDESERSSSGKLTVTAQAMTKGDSRSTSFKLVSKTGVEATIVASQLDEDQTLTITPTSVELDAKGTAQRVKVTVSPENSGNNWSVAHLNDDSKWIKVNYPVTTADGVYLEISADKNVGKEAKEKNGTLVLTSNTGYTCNDYQVSVTQAALNQTITFSPETLTLAYNDTQYYDNKNRITPTIDPKPQGETWSWTIKEGSDWLSAEKNGSGQQLKVKAKSQNTGSEARTAIITFTTSSGSSEDYTVTQNPIIQTITLNPTSWSPDYQAGSKDVTVSKDIDIQGKTWSFEVVGEDTDWLSAKKKEGLGNENKVTVSVTKNTDTEKGRTGTVQFKSATGKTTDFVVTQGALTQTLTLNPTSWNTNYQEAQKEVSVSVNEEVTGKDWKFEVTSGDSWLSAARKGDTEPDKNKVILSVTPNTGKATREGTVTFTSATGEETSFTVTQTDGMAITDVSPSPITISANGKKYKNGDTWTEAVSTTKLLDLTVTQANGGADWSVKSSPSSFWDSDPTKNENKLELAVANKFDFTDGWPSKAPSGKIVLKAGNDDETETEITVTRNRPVVLINNNSQDGNYFKYTVKFEPSTNWQYTASEGIEKVKKSKNGDEIGKDSDYNLSTVYIKFSNSRTRSITFKCNDGSKTKITFGISATSISKQEIVE